MVLILSIFCSACINNFAVQKLIDTAKECMDEGDAKAAISNLESAVELDGNIYESRYNLAVAYYESKNCNKALEQIEAASKLRNNEAAVYYMQAVINTCLADEILKQDINKIDNQYGEDKYEIKNADDATKYVEYLKNTNTAFDNFMNIAKTTDRNADIVDRINNNKDLISKYSLKFGI